MNIKKLSPYLLLIGMAFLTLGLATDNKMYTIASLILVLLSLFAGGRLFRRK